MAHPTKITTCCYCGARAALVLRGKVSHELSCSSCGAPIHVMKRVPLEPAAPARREAPRKAVSHRAPPKSFDKPKKRKKKRKSALRWLAEEAWDVLEDVFD